MRTETYATATKLPPSQLTNGAAGTGSPVILLVDGIDASRRTLKALLHGTGERVLDCARASEALEIISREEIDLMVIDFALPGMTGAELCRWLKVNATTRLVPVIIIGFAPTLETELAVIASGADVFVARPINPAVLRAKANSLLRRKSVTDTLENAEAVLFSLAQAVEQRDHFTGEHCHRMAVYSVALGKAAGVPAEGLLALYRAAYLHDIGKVSIPDAILFKKGPLNSKEWRCMQGHAAKGEEICRPMKSLAPVLPVIRSHHERWDGSGYPDGLRGEEIPQLARILQVCDIYDALTNVRPYKRAFSHDEAVVVLEDEVRRGWRDPELVALFADVSRDSLPGIMAPSALEFSGMLSLHHSIVNCGGDQVR